MKSKEMIHVARHVIMCCGAKVEIVGKEVKVLSEPLVCSCPLMEKLYNVKNITKETVERIMRFKIEKFGIATSQRKFDCSLVVPYGASEMIKCCLRKGIFDCAVLVCDGAGTVITSNPDLAQAIGARLTGIIETSPIPQIIQYIRNNNGYVLDEENASIDQLGGVKRAITMGFRKIAVTIAGFNASCISKIRKMEKENVEITIFSVCNTCVTEKDIIHIQKSDLVWASASKIIREIIGQKAVLQLGIRIPVFALTNRGKKVILSYLEEISDTLLISRVKLPYIISEKQPKLQE